MISIPSLTTEQKLQETAAFDNFETNLERLMTIAGPIMSANTALCRKTRLDIGVSTHSLKSYSKSLRSAASRELGAVEDISIFHVRSGSSAKQTPASLRIKRGDREFSVSVEPEKICNYPVKLSQTSTINAYANGRIIIMTAGMMNFVKDDNELALILGHELAHNTMGYYIARAGYSLNDIEDVWRRLAISNPKSVVRAKTHPTFPDRYLRISAARDEINAKKASGQALLPNFKTQK